MRILFLGSSLEPGRDGVGDYLRLLAGACARRGHSCALLALSDPFVTVPIESFSSEETGKISLLRLPVAMPWERRMELARDFRIRFHPGWLSFHLVGYAFQKRGMLFGLAPLLRSLTQGVPLHLMFHELWVGAGAPSPLRHHVTGFLQRRGIRHLLSLLQPRLVTTSNPVYAAMLRKLDTEAGVLPLFGNIPVVNAATAVTVCDALSTLFVRKEDSGWWVGIFFSGLHEDWQPEPVMGLLERAAQRAGRRLILVSAGRMGAGGEALWNRLKTAYAGRIEFLNLGEQPAIVISGYLQTADFGISSAPWQLIGKSGAAAAMLDHGLPVIVSREDFRPYVPADGPPATDPLLHRCDGDLESKLIAGLPKRPPRARVDEVAADLCGRLQSAGVSAS